MFLSVSRQLPHMRCFQRKYTIFQAAFRHLEGFGGQVSAPTLEVAADGCNALENFLGDSARVDHKLPRDVLALIATADT